MCYYDAVKLDTTNITYSEEQIMFMEERLIEIEKIIKEKGKINTAEIQRKFAVSFETARRDLRVLEERGVCKRMLFISKQMNSAHTVISLHCFSSL